MLKRFLLIISLLLIVSRAFAEEAPSSPASQSPDVAPLETIAKFVALVEAATGDVLFAKDADAQMSTSSMSKVLTMYIVFEAIRDGKLSLTTEVPVSERAWKQEGSRMFINPGDKVKVEDLVRGVIVQSGNDAAVALAEAVAGSEEQFAELMNAKAQQLGMNGSHFKNATGLPDPDHYSTAGDLAKLAHATIRDFPEYYHYYAEIDFTYNNIKQGNRNPLLYRNMGVDGLKTGHTSEAGFGMIASSLRDGRRLIMVVNGLKNMQERADESARILDWGYREYGLYPVLKKDAKMAEAKVWLGVSRTVDVQPEKDVMLSLPRSARNGLKVTLNYNQPITAPIIAGQVVGSANIEIPDKDSMSIPLVAGSDVAQVGFIDRIILKLKMLIGKE